MFARFRQDRFPPQSDNGLGFDRGHANPFFLLSFFHCVSTMLRVLLTFPTILIFFAMPNGLLAEIQFNRDIRPILSEKCYFCHGPDASHREADLRFDTAEGAAESIASGEFLTRIHSDDPEIVMPKPASKLSLTHAEKELLEAWVKAGAKYDIHWAFAPLPQSVPIPKTKNPNWARQAFDHFVAEQQIANGLHPSPEADPVRWLRRVSLDLTGLPPSLDALSLFQRERNELGEAAFSNAVDRLLNSYAYGQHMAVGWLDAARYADSYGYQSDKLNTQWPYRDWVVKALNDNLPYDQFLTWQLAGDLLPNPTREQRLATAFNRIHRLNNEGGAVFEEWRQENVADRVHTFGTAILGLTLECCRCHDHKYDPISARDYYSLSAFFNSIDENGLYDRTEKVPSPTMLLPSVEQAAAIELKQAELAAAEADYQRTIATAKDRMEGWSLKQRKHRWVASNPSVLPDQLVALGFDAPWDESLAKTYQATTLDKTKTSPLDTVAVEDSKVARLGDSEVDRKALVLDGERGITVYNVEPLDRWTPFSCIISFRETKRQALRSVIAHHSRGTDAGYNGWDLTIEDGYVESRLYRVWPGNALGIRTKQPIPANRWHQLAATYDGSSKASGLKLYLNGELLDVEIVRDKVLKSVNVKVDHGGQLVIGSRFRARGLDGGLVDDFRLYSRALTKTELGYLSTGAPIAMSAELYASAYDNACRASFAKLTEARKAFVMAEEVMDEIPIMEEMEEPLAAYVLARGAYDAPKNDETRVTRNVPPTIGPSFPENAPRDRLGLADWVTHPDHPLTSRVIVNRLWANFFGAGLVRTPENFGLTGEQPTHPELLDWLARDFIDRGWNIKEFCKSIVLSATYRQNSAVTPELLAKDPENRLLARGPAYRLSAEQIRDLALAATGLLNDERGGPPVSPYQAGGDLWKENNGMSPPYVQSVGKALYRRSLYSVWKRTAPLPNMMAFDSNSREVCSVKRLRTNTPLQALVLLNDIQFIEAARVFAQSLLSAPERSDASMIGQAFLAMTSRAPDAFEIQSLSDLLADERTYYRENPAEASKLVKTGESPLSLEFTGSLATQDESQKQQELAALTNVIQAILNLDATVWSR
jgi:hypothetical protein